MLEFRALGVAPVVFRLLPFERQLLVAQPAGFCFRSSSWLFPG